MGFLFLGGGGSGLSQQHHGELNSLPESSRYDELRREYSDDPIALQQIDVYDGSTEYHGKFIDFVNAVKSGDSRAEESLGGWFIEHYPDI